MTKPLVFQHGAATTAFNVAIGVWVVFELVMTVRQSLRLGRPPARDPSSFMLVACLTGSVFAAVRLGQGDLLPWPGGRVWPVVVGIALLVWLWSAQGYVAGIPLDALTWLAFGLAATETEGSE